MTTIKQSARLRAFGIALMCILSSVSVPLAAQTANAPETGASTENQDEVIVLSPFTVDATEDAGNYKATSTLAGSRVRTDLKDIASAISVVTAQFLKDTGATNNQTLLQYTTNTEVGGIYGNFGGVGNTFVDGATEPNLTRPSQNTRVRGLDTADNTRDFFLSDIPWDSYNVGRVDIQRGPNSILFGIGSPAGIINASVNTAGYKNEAQVENRLGSYGSVRTSLDVNRVILPNELALRVTSMDDQTKYRQDPAFNHDKRLFGAVRWDPQFLQKGSAHTTVRANFERGYVNANRPRVLPPEDDITPFFLPRSERGVGRTAYDGYYAWQTGIMASGTGSTVPYLGETSIYWLNQNYAGAGGSGGYYPRFYYDNLSTDPGSANYAATNGPSGSGPASYFAIGPNGQQDSQIDGFPFGGTIGIGNYGQMALTANLYEPSFFQGAGSGFYKAKSLTDPTIFDFYNNLIDGPNKREWQGWNAFNIALEQTFLDNRLGFEVVYDHQEYNDGSKGNTSPFISVDINANRSDLPWALGRVVQYNGTGTPGSNPDAGRAYVGNRGSGGGRSSESTRESVRATVTGELRATDFLSKSWLSDLLGRHVVTALGSKDSYRNEERTWHLYAIEASWDNTMGTGNGPNGSGSVPVANTTRDIATTVYLSDPLFNVSSASGLNLKPITSLINPSGSGSINYFDSHWKWSLDPGAANYVDPAAPWTNPTVVNGGSQASTQSENPDNYVGWRKGTFRILNADTGDINSLYDTGAKLRQDNTAVGLTWQAYLWNDTLVGTYGWRRDTQKQRSGAASLSAVTGAADMSYDVAATGTKSTGDSKSWGVVLHQPKAWRHLLPWGTTVSLMYNQGRNVRVQNRYDFDGNPLPNASGLTKDYGFAVNTLDDRLQVKVTWYKTTVSNANLSSVATSENTLGGNAYMIYYHPAWVVGGVLQALGAYAGDHRADSQAWCWNYTDYAANTPEFNNDPATIMQKAAIASFLSQIATVFPQSWWDAYGYPIDVAKVAAGDYNNAVAGWDISQGNWAIRSGTNGTINGVAPVGTVDNQSKGVEIEIVGRPLKNLSVSFNASKQTASQQALGSSLTTAVLKQKAFWDSAAGDIRLWGRYDQPMRATFTQNIWAAYAFQAGTNGKMVPEMAPWRYNMVVNYAFDRGFLKGLNIGGAYRWEKGHILGYALNDAKDNLDVDRPFWSGSESHTDLWAGYERKLTSKINWRVQLNLRSVGENPRLKLLSVQPDGSPALYRIQDGMIWSLTNTLSF